MAPPNKILLPDNLDRELGDLRRRILALETAGAQPTVRPYTWDVDPAHPAYLDFVIPSGVQIPIAKLSFKFVPYRTTSSFAGGNTGVESASHTHASAAHSHSHAHTIPIVQDLTAHAAVFWNSAGNGNLESGNTTGNTSAINSDATSTTPGSTGSDSVDHTHPVGASSLGVSEGASTTISTFLVDGGDKTSTLGGPWLTDTVGLDIAKVLPLGDGLFHRIQLTPAGQGRIVAEFSVAI